MSDSLRSHGPQHARPPCPSPTPRAHQNSCPLSRWCHPAISCSVVPLSSRLQSFPTSGGVFKVGQWHLVVEGLPRFRLPIQLITGGSAGRLGFWEDSIWERWAGSAPPAGPLISKVEWMGWLAKPQTLCLKLMMLFSRSVVSNFLRFYAL